MVGKERERERNGLLTKQYTPDVLVAPLIPAILRTLRYTVDKVKWTIQFHLEWKIE